MNDWTNAETRAERAHDLYDEGRLSEAAAELRAAINVNPYNASWHFNLGLALEAMEDYARACEAFEASLGLKDNDIKTLNCLGVNMNRLGRYSDALGYFERIEQLDPTYEPCYCNRIVSYAETSQHEQAELMFYTARLFKDACPLCCYNLGNSFYNGERYDRAIDCWKQTLRLDADHPQAHGRIADAYWAMGDLESARRYYQIELDLYPDDPDVMLDYGELLMNMGRLDEAGKQFRGIVEHDTDSAAAHFYLGEIALKRSRLAAAEQRFIRTLRLDPKYAGAHAKLGQIMLRRGKNTLAGRHFLAEMKRCGNDGEMLLQLGRLLLEIRQAHHANSVLRRLVENDPDNAEAQHNLALSFFLLDRMDDGIRHCRKAIKLRSEYPLALYNLALAHYRRGQIDRAGRYIAKALTIAPQHEEIRGLARKLGSKNLLAKLRGFLPRRRKEK